MRTHLRTLFDVRMAHLGGHMTVEYVGMYECVRTYAPFLTYVWRTWEGICIYLLLLSLH